MYVCMYVHVKGNPCERKRVRVRSSSCVSVVYIYTHTHIYIFISIGKVLNTMLFYTELSAAYSSSLTETPTSTLVISRTWSLSALL